MKCPGSFRTVSTDVAGRKTVRFVDKTTSIGTTKVQVPCPVCGKTVGLRSELAGSRGILAMHNRPEVPKHTVALDIETQPASGTSVPLLVTVDAPKLGKMKIQEILGAFLSAHGKHAEAARAFESTDRLTWEHLADEAIRSAPESERTHVAHTVKLALDAPETGGPGQATDFEIRPETRRVPAIEGAQPGEPIRTMYRAWMKDATEEKWHDCGLASEDISNLKRRIVGLYVAREIKVVE